MLLLRPQFHHGLLSQDDPPFRLHRILRAGALNRSYSRARTTGDAAALPEIPFEMDVHVRDVKCRARKRGKRQSSSTACKLRFKPAPFGGPRLFKAREDDRFRILRRKIQPSRFHSPGTLFYCDPPYPHESRGDAKVYGFEMSDKEHEELAAALHKAEGAVAISSYRRPLMDRLYKDWFRVMHLPIFAIHPRLPALNRSG